MPVQSVPLILTFWLNFLHRRNALFDSKLLNLFELVNLLVCSKNELKPSYPFFQHNIDEDNPLEI